MGTIITLMALSGGLFAYENVYKVHQAEKNKTVIYVAKEDIQAHTVITEGMFEPVEIDNSSVLSSYVTNLKSVVGKELKGGLLKGEPLSQQRLTDKNTENREIVLKIEPDMTGDISTNDNVRIYVQLENRDTGEIKIEKLFDFKKVIDDGRVLTADVKSNNDKDSKSFNVYASSEEVQNYYLAKAKGSIIVVKLNELDTEPIASNEKVENFDANSEVVKKATKSNEASEGQAVITYTVKEGDTLDSLSLKFKTKPETIKALNDGKTEFKAGEMIQVPAD